MTRLELASLRLQWAQTKAAADCGAHHANLLLDPLPHFGVDPLRLVKGAAEHGLAHRAKGAEICYPREASRSGRADMQVS
ncbi:hypothetical protein SIDU_01670 [Sphingobium indicum B90A]|uniref:Uncharacterized protein n=1 Tax=Sphingobium indicum (strain DSM 16412 / CCM 7286 / MTCC 6364 / B90A) TaxID=861109 RepID=A0A1L5BKB1_SPHIB|nr:hypothetical protein SIDU_01670 [Sphingobium indicum B90A]